MKKKTKIGVIIGAVLLGLMSFIFIDVHPDGTISLDGDGFYKRHFMNKEKNSRRKIEEDAEKLKVLKSCFNDYEKIPEFNCKDVKGNKVTQEIFGDYKLTMINIWSAY